MTITVIHFYGYLFENQEQQLKRLLSVSVYANIVTFIWRWRRPVYDIKVPRECAFLCVLSNSRYSDVIR